MPNSTSQKISKKLTAGLAVLLLIVLCSCYWGVMLLHAQEQPTTFESDFFWSNGKRIPVSVILDQIGVLVKEGVSPSRIKVVAERFDLTFVREIRGSVLIFGVSDVKLRLSLARLARKFKEKNTDLVVKAGLLIMPERAKVPMIMSDEFIVQFKPKIDEDQINDLNSKFAVEVVMENFFFKNQFLLRVTEKTRMTALELSNQYEKSEITEYAHPNFVQMRVPRQAVPNDALFANQWHHHNTGQSGGTVDADIDSPEAWAITQGQANILIAVIDGGFDMGHPDLTPNYWTNAGETAGNGADDDGNGFVDDVNGWDFTGCNSAPGAGCGDNNPTGSDTVFGRHGTAVAGSAAARGSNALGVTGSCQNCTIMPIRVGGPAASFTDILAFSYARQMGADIITNSWGYEIGTPVTTALVWAINNAATYGRGGLGSVVLFAMNNDNVNDCGANPDISSLPKVIAVSRATNQDQFDHSGFGNCMDLLAPSAGLSTVTNHRGTLWATTTDMRGNAGYNNNNTPASCPSAEASPPPANARNYTACFNGTSFATPLTAGVAGLILSANPGLTRVQVQRLLQDTADKIEDSAGNYAPETGFSTPATGNATHGWGRVNAFEAVRIAAPTAKGGKAGVDIFIRDNRLDWGNTEQPSNVLFEPKRAFVKRWGNMDIKVDAPPYEATAPTAVTFDAFPDNTPSAAPGDNNKVYVRVRNRGPVTASAGTVKLHWAQYRIGRPGSITLPELPLDFWTSFPANSTDTTQWHPLNCGGSKSPTCAITNLDYSGSSVANTANDAAQIVQFDFPAPPRDPKQPDIFCLLAMIDSPQDRVLPLSRRTILSDFRVNSLMIIDNNVAHRTYSP